MAKPLRKSSMSSISDDDIDAITPCPLPKNKAATQPMISPERSRQIEDFRTRRSTSPSSVCSSIDACEFRGRRRESIKALEEGTGGDPERLWKRMLALQQIYGCYNSARMSAALSSGNASLLLPSKACLDLMNEHMAVLPDDVEPVRLYLDEESDLIAGRDH
ncbi:hypothetical protein F5X96DRAFT_409633 [Biscogniauxia mediterranea]|nr:hypothetical protein F5X96DRAFT_409633 [Biscogniauxia mediterranea]